MSSKSDENFEQYVIPLYINGLQGRMLYVPAKKSTSTRQILLLYGRRTNLEHYFPLARHLSAYGTVTMPDLPGFGGMVSFYRLGEKPTLDTLADYLAAFVKLRYKKRRLTIVGISFGFVVATRMLQKYPDIAKKVDLVISVGGFTRKDDFKISPNRYWHYNVAAWIGSRSLPAWLMQQLLLRPAPLKTWYKLLGSKNTILQNVSPDKHKDRLLSEAKLWQDNDFRTYALATYSALKVDLTTKQLPMRVYHIAFKNDQMLDNAIVEQHMRIIFKDYRVRYMPKVGYYYDQEISNLPAFINNALVDSGL